jgi:hypothetical protein
LFAIARGRQLERDTVSTGRQPKGRGKGRGKGATAQGVNAQLGTSFHQIGKVIDAEARVQGWSLDLDLGDFV